jgi:hypothetical protein
LLCDGGELSANLLLQIHRLPQVRQNSPRLIGLNDGDAVSADFW